MYYWDGQSWLPIATGGSGGSSDGTVHIVSETTPPDGKTIGDLWLQPNAPDAPPSEGQKGDPGLAATIEVAETLTIEPGLPASVVNIGNENKALLSFKIPAGLVGEAGQQGEPGVAGAAGEPGPAGPPGERGLQGEPGVPGQSGAQGPQGVPGEQGQPGLQGPPGLGITYKGTVADESTLPATATQGDLYVVSTPAPARGFVWDAETSSWVDAGPVQGPQGVPGPQGVQGERGDPGPSAVSADPDNISVIGSDGLIHTKLPYPRDMALGGVLASYPQANKYVAAINDDGTVWLEDLPSAPPAYTLPAATATTLGGVKVGSGIAVTADGTISTSAVTGFLPLAGGTMTGTINVPNSINAINTASGFNLIGSTAGLVVRSGTTNLMSFGVTTIDSYKPIALPADPTANLHAATKQYVDSKASAYTLPAATATVLGGVKIGTGVTVTADGTISVAGGGGGVTNPVAGSASGMTIWIGTQSAYDAIATKDAKTLYHITG